MAAKTVIPSQSELGITPSGRLEIIFDDSDAGLKDHLINAFALGLSDGLMVLATTKTEPIWKPSWVYWHEFVCHYLDGFVHITSDADEVPKKVEASEGLMEGLVESVPPMPGGEWVNVERLSDLWTELDAWVRDQASQLGGVRKFLEKHAPLWHQVGRVCFHLAENPGDEEYPFAFLATYASRVGKGSRVQHLPLGKALEEYAKDKKTLVRLLEPVDFAAKRQPWVRELVDTAEIYHPMAWTPDEAHRLLLGVPDLEESGLTVRLPDWWKKRPRPRVQVSVKSDSKSKLDSDALLSFNIGVALGDESLSLEEVQAMLKSDGGLVLLRGQWVEVDRDKLKEALDHWQSVAEDSEGMSFLDGMRLLAGVRQDLSGAESVEDEAEASWSFIAPSPELKAILEKLRRPDELQHSIPKLNAELRPYQKNGVSWLKLTSELGLGACLADDMGLGKTVQVLALLLLRRAKKAKNSKPCLLVLPASLVANWRAEQERFAPSLKAVWLHSSEMSKTEMESFLDANDGTPDLVATTYGMLRREKRLADREWDLVILDEAHAIKNAGAQQTKAVKTLQSRSRVALTGTPVENRLADLWSLFDFLNPGLLGSLKKFQQFTAELAKRPRQPYAPLRRLVSPYILRRLKTDKSVIADLPEKIELTAWCGLSKRQATIYGRLVHELKTALDEAKASGEASPMQRRGLILASLMKFKQICNHPSQFLNDGGYQAADSGKFARLHEIAETVAGKREKMLVFSQFREIAEPLCSFLKEIFGRPGLILHGGVDVKKRAELVKDLQSESGAPFMVLSLKAGGVGLNLTEASHVVHFDRWWNPAVENQATDRAFRIGQKRNVLVHKFSCRGTVEERIDRMLNEKAKLAAEVVGQGGGEALLTEMSDEQLLDTLRLDLERAAI